LKEEQKRLLFKEVLRKDEITKHYKKLHTEEIRNLKSPDILRSIKSELNVHRK
jgi:hypothetical protein